MPEEYMPSSNITMDSILIFPDKYHQNPGFYLVILVYQNVHHIYLWYMYLYIYTYIYIYMRTMGSQYSCLKTKPILWAGPGMKHQTTSWGGYSTSWAQAQWWLSGVPNWSLTGLGDPKSSPMVFLLFKSFPTETPPPKKKRAGHHGGVVFERR